MQICVNDQGHAAVAGLPARGAVRLQLTGAAMIGGQVLYLSPLEAKTLANVLQLHALLVETTAMKKEAANASAI